MTAAGTTDSGAQQPRYRPAARVILLDPADRVLLSQDTWRGRQWQILPGGGVELGETPAEAALREVREETGFVDVVLGPVVLRNRFQMHFVDGYVDQDEWVFLGRTAGGRPDDSGLTELERTFMGGFNWWTHAQLASCTDTVYPVGLADMLATLLTDGPPAEPWQLGGPPP